MTTRSRQPAKPGPEKQPPAPWERANPKPKAARSKLSAAARDAARARARKAGRRYPNLIDNMWAAQGDTTGFGPGAKRRSRI